MVPGGGYLSMDHIDSSLIALRNEGYSFQQIGERLGITKDAAQKRHRRLVDGGSVRSAHLPLGPDAADRTRHPAGDRPVAPPVPVSAPDRPSNPAGYVGFDMGYFDLESTALNGSFGRLHCGACAHVDGSVWVARIDDPRYQNKRQKSDDGRLAVAIRDHLETHDILVSWNGKRSYSAQGRGGFDVPMLNARLINVRERLLDRYVEHIDLLKEARKHLQLAQYRLAAVQTFLELEEEKSAITPRVWQKALDHDKDALDYIVEHCVLDVRVLREVFEEFRQAKLLRRASR